LADQPDFPIVIIGCGFAGIGSAIQLRKRGIRSFTIFERANEIGGTWRDNTYPGAACDVPSHLYSFSFEPNPRWSRSYAQSGEIQDYLLRCVEKWHLREHLRLGTAIVEARFNEEEGLWTLTTQAGDRVTARVVISGVGGLVNPAHPEIPGLERFEGEVFHTARWNHDYDLRGKQVAVIGTGASAVQVVPAIAPKVGKLSVFQRTAGWVMPKHDRVFSEKSKRFFERFPLLQRLLRTAMFWRTELQGPIVFLDSPLTGIAEKASERHLRSCVGDRELRAKLRPSFQLGCKRVLVSDDYWPAFERENVELVTEKISAIDRSAVETADGRRHPVDAIILATGFEVGLVTAPFEVIGREGRRLCDAWGGGAVAYKGMSVSGFPNWFILMGPNTGPGHTSVLVYTETQIQYVLQAIERLMTQGLRYVDVRQDVQDAYNAGLQRRMKHTVWSSGCKSWYLSEDGTNHALYPGFASEYCARIRNFRMADYQVASD
jgi:cation diffusion facilitator CzcD-associated flavoprotein CzcO